MPRRQVDVGADEELVVRVPADDLPEPTGDVVAETTARRLHDALRLGQPAEVDAGRPVERVAHRRLAPLALEVGEEERPVAGQRAADAGAPLAVEEGGDRHVVDAAADQPLVAAVEVAGPAEGVRAAARDDVDAAAGEAALPHVVGRHHELQLADRVEADRLRVRLPARRPLPREAEQVVVHGAVDLDVVVAAAPAGHAQEALGVGVAARLDEERIHPREVLQAALDGRQRLDDAGRHPRRRARARRREHLARLGDHLHRLGQRGELQRDRHLRRFAQGHDQRRRATAFRSRSSRSRGGRVRPARSAGRTVPSARVKTSYSVPVGTCTATTPAPGSTPCCASRTTPPIVPVVAFCAFATPAGPTRTAAATVRAIHCVRRFMSGRPPCTAVYEHRVSRAQRQGTAQRKCRRHRRRRPMRPFQRRRATPARRAWPARPASVANLVD